MHSQIRMLGSTQLHGGVGVAPADPQGSRFGFHSGFPIGFLGSNLREVLPCWGPEPHPGSLLGPSLNDGLKKAPPRPTAPAGATSVCAPDRHGASPERGSKSSCSIHYIHDLLLIQPLHLLLWGIQVPFRDQHPALPPFLL